MNIEIEIFHEQMYILGYSNYYNIYKVHTLYVTNDLFNRYAQR